MDFFNQKFIAEEIDALYINFEIFSEYPNIAGLNVTAPYKEEIISLLDDLDETAMGVGAVNVIKIIRNVDDSKMTLVGYNTDMTAFKNSIQPLINDDMTKALVLGTGGASKAVKSALEQLGIDVSFVSRKKSASTFTYEELTKQMIHEHKIIVNTTPMGTYPAIDQCPDIPYRFITPAFLQEH